jgi:hypothetical protein
VILHVLNFIAGCIGWLVLGVMALVVLAFVVSVVIEALAEDV